MPIEKRIRISSRLSEVARASAFVREIAEAAGLNEEGTHHCQLAVDEACTNIIEHGYSADDDRHQIEIVAVAEADRLLIYISDEGPPFNPLEHSDPDPNMQLEEREGGGWGVYFIKKLMNEVYYQYDKGRNRLTLVKYFSSKTATHEQSSPIRVASLYPNIGLLELQNSLETPAVNRALEKVISMQYQSGVKYLILDLHQVESISIEMLKMLVSQRKRARDLHGDLILTALTPSARELIDLTGFDLVLTVTESVESALTHLSSGSK